MAIGVHLAKALFYLALPLLPSPSNARCECGYSVNETTDAQHAVWTELFETDFLHVNDLHDTGWVPQAYNVTRTAARGTYGKMALVENVRPNPFKRADDWAGEAADGSGQAGLQLVVRAAPVEDMVRIAEVVAVRTDMLYGSFRVAMRVTGTPGTCGAFFWFRNDTQEIDMEFLSKQLDSNTTTNNDDDNDKNPVNLVLQSPQSAAAGYDASHTSSYDLHPLPFAPDAAFHEYRFDWLPDRVSFYADGVWLTDMTAALPNSPGHLVLNHWSNGDDRWSAGPPAVDATLSVSYVKAYFNSSDAARQKDYYFRCTAAAAATASSVCPIPLQDVPPDDHGHPAANASARTFFFSADARDTPNQTVFGAWRGHTSGAAATALSSPPPPCWLCGVAAAVALASAIVVDAGFV